MSPPDPALRRATLAVYVAFIASGFAFASWASRIPQVRDLLELSPRGLGFVLLAIAAGSLVSLPLAGLVVARLGTARAVAVTAGMVAVGLTIAALGVQVGVALTVAGLFLLGLGNGTWDVSMNVEGAEVERRLERAIMPRFHAGFSVGTVAGALLGAAMVALGVSPTAHLLGVAALVGVVVPLAVRGFLPRTAAAQEQEQDGQPAPSVLRAWTEPRTLLVGVFVFTAAFTEGTGNDWLGVAVIDGLGAEAAVGTLTFALFLAAMTAGRWFGPGLLDRLGRVTTIRVLTALGLAGLTLVVFGGSVAAAMAGATLWGLGVSLGFPVGMSAAADEPERAAGRVSVVASIGYVAFLAGPPLIGLLGDEVGVLRALTATAGLLALGLLLSGVLRPPEQPAADPAGHLAEAPGR